MKQKMTTMIALVFVLLLALVACGGNDEEVTVPTVASPAEVPTLAAAATEIAEATKYDSSWEKVQAEGKIVVGTAADYAPFEAYNAEFQLDGFDIALMNAIAQEMGYPVEFHDMAFDGLGDALLVNQIDVAISAISATPDRAKYVDFSNVYFATDDSILTAVENPLTIATVEDLANYKIGVQKGSVYADWLFENLVETELVPLTSFSVYQTVDEAVEELAEGQIDLIVLDKLAGDSIAAANNEFVNSEEGLYTQRFAIAMGKGESDLQAEINRALGVLQMNGSVDDLAELYLGLEEMPEIIDPEPPTNPDPAPDECYDAMQYVADVTYDDKGMTSPPVLAPGQPFDKTWRFRNVGTCDWTTDYRAVYVGGNSPLAAMGGSPTNMSQVVQPGQTIDLTIPMVAPLYPGTYQGVWELRNAENEGFGDRFWVGIMVPGAPTPTPAPTSTPSADINFTADSTQITQGECTVLRWEVSNIDAVWVYPLGEPYQNYPVTGTGSRQVCPATTTIYEMRVQRTDGLIELRQVQINVIPVAGAPTIQRFTVEPSSLPLGHCTVLQWDVRGDVSNVNITVNGSTLDSNAPDAGSRQHCPTAVGEQIYRLTATGPGGTTQQQKNAQVYQPTTTPPTATPIPPDPPPVINSFSTTPNQLETGQCTTISWSVGGGTTNVRVLKNGNVIVDNGSFSSSMPDCIDAAGQYVYRLEARGSNGQTETRESTVVVTDAAPDNPLAGTNWKLTAMNVNQVVVGVITASFTDSGNMSGSGGCNTYNTSYSVSGSNITIAPPSGTGMMCTPEMVAEEDAYFAAMPLAATFEINSGKLIINDSAGQMLLQYDTVAR